MYENKQQNDVLKFMVACGQASVADQEAAISNPLSAAPRHADRSVMDLRRNLLLEEVQEYVDADNENDVVSLVDGLIDIVYIVQGTLVELGVDFQACWDEVHASNMTKVDPETGKVRKREDGKILKPPSYRRPDLKSIIRRGA